MLRQTGRSKQSATLRQYEAITTLGYRRVQSTFYWNNKHVCNSPSPQLRWIPKGYKSIAKSALLIILEILPELTALFKAVHYQMGTKNLRGDNFW